MSQLHAISGALHNLEEGAPHLTSELLHGAESADTAFSAQQRGSAQPLAASTGARYTSQHAQYSDYIRYGVGIG